MNELVDDDDVYFVLTVPAKWDVHGRQMMRVAANMVILFQFQF